MRARRVTELVGLALLGALLLAPLGTSAREPAGANAQNRRLDTKNKKKGADDQRQPSKETTTTRVTPRATPTISLPRPPKVTPGPETKGNPSGVPPKKPEVGNPTPPPAIPSVEPRSGTPLNEAVVKAIVSDLAETRAYRRDAAREEIWKRWGTATRSEPVRNELRVHGRRLARLHHVLRLARAARDSASAARAENLLFLEGLRHERAMLDLFDDHASKGKQP